MVFLNKSISLIKEKRCPSLFVFSLIQIFFWFVVGDKYINPDVLKNGDGSMANPFNDLKTALISIIDNETLVDETLQIFGKSAVELSLHEQKPFLLSSMRSLKIFSESSGIIYLRALPLFIIEKGSKLSLINLTLYNANESNQLLSELNYIFLVDEANLLIQNTNFCSWKLNERSMIFCMNNGTINFTQGSLHDNEISEQASLFRGYGCHFALRKVSVRNNTFYNEGIFFELEDSNLTLSNFEFLNNSLLKTPDYLFQNYLFYVYISYEVLVEFSRFSENKIEGGNIFMASQIAYMNFTASLFVGNLADSLIIMLNIDSVNAISLKLSNNCVTRTFQAHFIINLFLYNFSCHENNNRLLIEVSPGTKKGGPCLWMNSVKDAYLLFNSIHTCFSYSVPAGLVVFYSEYNFSLILEGSEFINNRVKYDQQRSDYPLVSGCSVSIYAKVDLKIMNCYFKMNQIEILHSFIKEAGSPCVFINNMEANANIVLSEFNSNQGHLGSNCITAKLNTLLVNDSIFKNNSVTNSNDRNARGSTLLILSYYVKINRIVAEANSAISGGFAIFGTISSYFSHVLIIYNSTFKNQKAINDGVISLSVFDFKMYLTDCLFYNNVADRAAVLGGEIVSDYFYALIKGCIFKSNYARKQAGVAYISHIGGVYIFENSTFTLNKANKAAVFSYVGSQNSPVIVYNCIFSHNWAQTRGAVSCISGGTIKDSGSFYLNNSVLREGGLFVLENLATIELSNCTLENSLANISGGVAILLEQSLIFLREFCVIKYSFAKLGGCFVVYSFSRIEINDTLFVENKAEKGVLLYISNCRNKALIHRVIARNNTALVEGLLKIEHSSVELNNISFTNNKANVFFVSSSTLNVSSIILEQLRCSSEIKIAACFLACSSKSEAYISDLSMIFLSINDSGKVVIDVLWSEISLERALFFNVTNEASPILLKSIYSQVNLSSNFIFEVDSLSIYCASSSFAMNDSVYRAYPDYKKNSFLSCENCLSFIINRSIFSNSNCRDTKGGIFKITGLKELNNSQAAVFVISECIFKKNRALQGGAISVQDCDVLIVNSTFAENFAAENGGALYLSYDSSKKNQLDYIWTLKNNSFICNEARMNGGALYWEFKEPESILLNKFENNKAAVGENLASNPFFLIPGVNSNSLEASSGHLLEKSLNIFLVDAYLQKSKINQYGLASLGLHASDSGDGKIKGLYGQINIEMNDGTFTFPEITIVSTPNTIAEIGIKTDMIALRKEVFDKSFSEALQLLVPSSLVYIEGNFSHYIEKESKEYVLVLRVKMRPCIAGEIYQSQANTCDKCPIGQYSFSTDDEYCHDCPEEMDCFGGSNTSLKAGYWRKGNNDDKIYKCSRMSSCKGGDTDDICELGYSGILCKACFFNSTFKYFNGYGTICINCNDSLANVGFILVLMVIFIVSAINLLFIGLSVRKINKIRTSVSRGYGTYTAEIRNDLRIQKIDIYFKLLLNHCQMITLIASMRIEFPDIINDFKSLSEVLTSFQTIISPFECPLAEFSMKYGYSVYVLKIILSILAAYLILGLISIMMLIIKIKMRFKSFSLELIASLIITFFLLQPSLLSMLFSSLKCVQINNRKYVENAIDIPCDDYQYTYLILAPVLPNILIWMIIVPVGILVYMNRKQDFLYRSESYFLCDFIISGYKMKYYYWEFVFMLRKYLLIMINCLGGQNVAYFLTCFMLILFISLIELKKRPFREKILNTINIFSNLAIFVTFCATIFFSTSLPENIGLLLLVFVTISNLLFLAWWIRAFFPRLRLTIEVWKSFSIDKIKRLGSQLKRFIIRPHSMDLQVIPMELLNSESISKSRFTSRKREILY